MSHVNEIYFFWQLRV